MTVAARRVRARGGNTDDSATVNELRKQLERQHRLCFYTGQLLTPDNATVDHVVPLARGGSSRIENCVWCLATVNAAKGSMTFEEFIAVSKQIAERHGKTHQDSSP